MTDFVGVLNSLRRPRLLIRAARFGLRDYNRERDLRRLVQSETLPTPTGAIPTLIAEEQRIEATRRARDASYSPARHVALLVALIAEIRLLPGTAG
jgi:hypothetical protein